MSVTSTLAAQANCRTVLAAQRPRHLLRAQPRLVSNAIHRTVAHLPRTFQKCGAVATTLPEAEALDEMTVEDVKMVLQDTLYGTERGLSANSDARAEILELISQLEARNPTPLPNEALEKLSGEWKLVYTSNSELMAILALSKLPFITVGDIMQVIDGAAQTVENRVQLSAPFSRTSLSATASFEVRSPKLLQIQFQEGQLATPQLLADFELPTSADVMGQQVDLTAVRDALRPLDGPVRSLITQVGELLSSVPDLKVPIQGSARGTSTWLLTTFLDDDLRIARGDGGSVFVMIKAPQLQLPEDISVPTEEAVLPLEPDDVLPPAGPEAPAAENNAAFFSTG